MITPTNFQTPTYNFQAPQEAARRTPARGDEVELGSTRRRPSKNPSGCPGKGTGKTVEIASLKDVTAADRASAAASNNAFALDLFNRLADSEPGNLYVAPFSIFTATSLAEAGARGETRDGMRQGLHLELESGKAHAAVGSIQQDLVGREAPGREIKVANRVWTQEGMNVEPAFDATSKQLYGSTPMTCNFKKDPEAARQAINEQVEKDTTPAGADEGKIKDLIPKGILNQNSRFVLTNAFYLKDKWAKPFKESSVRDGRFNSPDGPVDAKMMRQTATYGYASVPGATLVEMPTANRDLTMVVILPDGEDTSGLKLTPQNVNRWLGAIEEKEVDLTVPSFSMTSALRLKEPLSAMGMEQAFSNSADFTGLSKDEGGYKLTEVVHQATVDVTPGGFETAAATAVIGGTRSAIRIPQPEETVVVDKPFVFMIRDRETGTILSAGRCDKPEAPKS